MQLLVLDHFFRHDIESIRGALGPGDGLRTIDYEVLRSEALRIFPADVATGIEAYARPELEPERRAYAAVLRELLEDEFTRSPYDAFVAPSDIFFYVRAAPEACEALGIPFFVAQKETTISGMIMEFADRIRRHAPPVAGHMTVCSERLREFFLRAGGVAERIAVTGQPRFDYYRRPESWPGDVPYGHSGPSVLFLSYHVDLHHPKHGQGVPVWARQHRETEQQLWELARRGWRVLVKPHPQQPWHAERRRIRAEAGDLLDQRVFLVDPMEDARRLLVSADVTVGFQSTAMLEAMLARRPVVYTGWDEEARALSGQLLPYAEWGDVVTVVERADDLADAVERSRGRGFGEAEVARIDALAETHLGPVDGQASKRVVEHIRAAVDTAERNRTAEADGRRGALARRRPPLRIRRRTRAGYRRLRRRVGEALGR